MLLASGQQEQLEMGDHQTPAGEPQNSVRIESNPVPGNSEMSNNINQAKSTGTQHQPIASSSTMEDTFYIDNPMWKELMEGMQCHIDDHICRILSLNGYRSYVSLKKFKEEYITDLEESVQTGGLLDAINTQNHHLYLGGATDVTKFTFKRGEKDLITSIIEYICKNHKEKDKPLGKCIYAYPMFHKTSSSQQSTTSNKRLKTSDVTVASLDLNSEVLSIKKLAKEYLTKNDFPHDYVNSISTMSVNVKTMERDGCVLLSASFICPVCQSKNLAAGYREKNKTWSTSNLNRHFKSHQKKNDKLRGTIDANFFETRRSTSNKSMENENSDPDDPFEGNESDVINLNDSDDQSIPRDASSPTAGIVDSGNLMHEGVPDSILIAYEKNKYSRGERIKRALGRHTPDQTRITAHFPILNAIEITLNKNKEMISELEARCRELSLEKPSSEKSNVSYLLKLLFETAQKNVDKKNHGQRYEEELKLFSVYLFIIGGRMLYEFLHANLIGSLPSITEVERILKKNSNPVIEGIFRFQELKDFLINHDLPLKVCISEDGTRIQQKFLYDSTTNQIIGPVLPVDKNGLPVTGSFPATSPAAIATHLKTRNLSSSAYAFMAQPLRKGAPSFCLCLFGTDNRFSAEHTFRRWSFTAEELDKIGVEVECFSADGDAKMLSAMHSLLFSSNTNFKEQWKNWFYAKNESKFTVIQDDIHTINKFRSRLSPSNFLPIGNFSVSITHLRLLIKEESQEKHGLTDQDLSNSDKMNFNASFKICSSRVTDLMLTTVPGCNATVAYLTNMRYVLEACLDDTLSAAERIYRIWHSTFFLRFWKLWLRNHSSYTMENFITSNLFVCVEVIAHAFIIMLIKFRDRSTPEFYLPSLFSSQPCESCFRLARSMTSTESTVINFSMKEFLSKVRRVDMVHHCVSKLSNKLEFPRDKRKRLLGTLHEERHQGTYLPNDNEILEIITTARNDAVSSLSKLGLKYSPTTSLVAIQDYLSSVKNFEDEAEINTNDTLALETTDINFTDDDIPLDILAAFPSPDEVPSLDITTVSTAEEILPPNSIYTAVPKPGGGFVKIRKSTFCWLIASNGLKLSSDRLQKVRQAVCTSMSNLKFTTKVTSEPFVIRKEEIEVGEWCIFRKVNGSGQCVLILGFRYLSGSGRSYTLPRAPVNPPSDRSKVRGLGCLCTRYNHNARGELTMVKSTVQCYLNIDNYVASISNPIFCNSKLCLPPQVLASLSDV